ncbi:MAG: hypothetical protein IJW74_03450 [Oscillospiraceae bacterium]|nr:hypothetical protein [Oscillospiraceae bacterium]
MLVKGGTREHLVKRDELWKYFKRQNEALYKAVNKTAMGFGVQFDGPIGRRAISTVYGLANKIFAFN